MLTIGVMSDVVIRTDVREEILGADQGTTRDDGRQELHGLTGGEARTSAKNSRPFPSNLKPFTQPSSSTLRQAPFLQVSRCQTWSPVICPLLDIGDIKISRNLTRVLYLLAGDVNFRSHSSLTQSAGFLACFFTSVSSTSQYLIYSPDVKQSTQY